jgi:hypothetical protein
MSVTTKYIFGEPDFLEGIGNVYPVKLKNYDEFVECSTHLYYSKDHFGEEFKDFSLLELLIFGLRDEKIVQDFEKLFSLVLKKDIAFFTTDYDFGFKGEKSLINKDNYDHLRNTIMKQNLMFEQKVYKNKVVQKWADKVIQARAKNSIKIEFEDKISTVSVATGKHYWDLAEYTIYQLETDFKRVIKLKQHEQGIILSTVSSDVSIEHFAENLDLYKSPYDDLFKDNKNNKLDKALK